MKLSKEQLEKELKEKSQCEIARSLGINRKYIRLWMKEYGIKSDYFTYSWVKETLLLPENLKLSPKELSMKYNVPVHRIKGKKEKWKTKLYTKKEILEKIKLYEYDLDNQGLPKQIKHDDPNLYTAILYHTKDHCLTTKKITEKLYRIENNFTKNKQIVCKKCQEPLKFYTYKLGYGFSDLCICNHCIIAIVGNSKVSQNLFWKLYHKLDDKEHIRFEDLNGEKFINVTETDKLKIDHIKLNKFKYSADFVYKDKIIEFDGEYWHKDKEKEIAKDLFYEHKGFSVLHIPSKQYSKEPKETLKKCIEFLKQ